MSTSAISAPAYHCNRTQRSWMSCAQFLTIAIVLSIATALVTPLYILSVVALNFADVNMAGKPVVVLLSIWMLAVFFVAFQIAARVGNSFGIRLHRGFVLTRWKFPDSIASLLFEMRITLGVFVGCQLVTGLTARTGLQSTSIQLTEVPILNPILLVSITLIAIGFLVTFAGERVFLQTRGRKIRRWVAACWRGVMLSSFIPEWDNTMRSIFDSCRTSRRLAMAYRALKIGTAGCFAASGCLAGITIGDSIPGMIIWAASIVATLSVWPSSRRIVEWSKDLMRSAQCCE